MSGRTQPVTRLAPGYVYLRHVDMPKAPANSSLDMLLLRLVDEGVSTLYQLHEQVGLSVGATHPALARLAKQGLVQGGEEGARSKKEYRLTRQGQALLAQLPTFIDRQLRHPPSDVESVLRTVSLAWVSGRSRDALELLARAADAALELADQTKADSARLEGQAEAGLPALYRWLEAQSRATRLDMAGRTLLALRRRLQKHSQGTRRRPQ